jgi:uncharacterized coiled-coil DUF342 family protein
VEVTSTAELDFCLTKIEECMAKIKKLNEKNEGLTEEIITEQKARNSNKDVIPTLNRQLADNDKAIEDYRVHIAHLFAQREGFVFLCSSSG